jgi:hypothetical protein
MIPSSRFTGTGQDEAELKLEKLVNLLEHTGIYEKLIG